MTQPTAKINVLFLCTGNSARSIMAEAILNKIGHPRFLAYSAGSHPTGTVNPLTIELLTSLHYSISTFRSKSWIDFMNKNSPKFDIIITVCDSAAAELCPIWPGLPAKVHWSLPDPAAAEGSHTDRLQIFAAVYQKLEQRIQHLLKLPPPPLSEEELKQHLDVLQRGNTYINGENQ